MLSRLFCAGLLTLVVLVACAAPTPPAVVVVHVAASELALPQVGVWASAYAQQQPQVLIVPLAAPASEAALTFTTVRPTTGFSTPVRSGQLNVVVNAANPLTLLTIAQVRALWQGHITRWDQIGGLPSEVLMVTRDPASEVALLLGGGLPPTSQALLVPHWAAMQAALRENPNALGYLPAALSLGMGLKILMLDAPLQFLIIATSPTEPVGPARDFLVWVQSVEKP